MNRIRITNIGILILLGVLFETTIASSFRLFMVSPTLGILAVGIVSYHYDFKTSLLFSFCSGLCLDLFLRTPFGVSSVVFILTCLIINILSDRVLEITHNVNVIVAAISGTVGGILYVLFMYVMGEKGLGLVFVIISTILDMLFVPVIAPLIIFVFGKENMSK